ncbi:MAG: hypothetical protein IBX69_03965 [Anaerolineales bacterium]|nr:hypothetical protein [Anaerolineales bacterium]
MGFFEQGGAHLACQEGLRGPGGAPEDGSGFGAGSHGGEVLIPFGGQDRLGFIAFEEQTGGGADHVGGGTAGEESDAGGTEAEDIGGFTAPAAAGGGVGIEDMLKAAHREARLRHPGGGNLDDLNRLLGVPG